MGALVKKTYMYKHSNLSQMAFQIYFSKVSIDYCEFHAAVDCKKICSKMIRKIETTLITNNCDRFERELAMNFIHRRIHSLYWWEGEFNDYNMQTIPMWPSGKIGDLMNWNFFLSFKFYHSTSYRLDNNWFRLEYVCETQIVGVSVKIGDRNADEFMSRRTLCTFKINIFNMSVFKI